MEKQRGLVYRTMQERMTEPDAKFDPAEVDKIARSLKNLSQAMSLEADFAKRIKDEARREAQAQIRDRIKELGSAAELKILSDEELAQKLAELTVEKGLV